jgi:hypothetical protein
MTRKKQVTNELNKFFGFDWLLDKNFKKHTQKKVEKQACIKIVAL